MATPQIEALLTEAMERYWAAEGGTVGGVRAVLEFALKGSKPTALTMMPADIVAFEIETGELNVGSVALGADWCIAIEGDGYSFEITHVWIDGKRVDEWERSLAQRWFDGDLATKDSRVRKAYRAKLSDRTADDDADDRGCHFFHQSRAA